MNSYGSAALMYWKRGLRVQNIGHKGMVPAAALTVAEVAAWLGLVSTVMIPARVSTAVETGSAAATAGDGLWGAELMLVSAGSGAWRSTAAQHSARHAFGARISLGQIP